MTKPKTPKPTAPKKKNLGNGYTDEELRDLKDRVCRGIAVGMSVKKICRDPEMPAESSVFLWLMNDPDFCAAYQRAREIRADARSERIDDITERVETGDLGPLEARVIIDAEKWQAAHEQPKRYGDRLQLDGDMTISMTDEQINARISKLLGKAGTAVAAGAAGAALGAPEAVLALPEHGSTEA